MYDFIDTTEKVREGWMTPGQVGDAYRWGMDFLNAQTTVFDALGSLTLVTGVAALLAVPMLWAMARLNRV